MASQHVGAGHDHPSTNGGPPCQAEAVDMKNSPELALMRTYAQRRRPKTLSRDKCPPTPPAEENEPRRKKKKSLNKRFSQLFSCVRAPEEEIRGGQEGPHRGNSSRSLGGADVGEETQASERVGELATALMDIADVVFVPPEIDTDSTDGEIERLAGQLLREYGDAMQQEVDCNRIFRELLTDYSLFSTLMSTVFRMVGIAAPDHGSQGPTESTSKANIAVTCEVASRLSALDTHPMSRVLGFGARYLKENCSLEAAMNVDEDTDSDQGLE